MKMRNKVGAIALLIMALLVAACSSGGNDTDDKGSSSGGSTGTEASASVSASEYADTVCGALNTWLTDIQTAAGSLPTNMSDPAQAKTELVSFLDGLAGDTDTLISTVEGAGTPDVDGGEDAAAAMSESFNNVKTIFEQARDTVSNLSTDNAKEFGQALQDLGTSLQDASDGATSSLDNISSPELETAFSESQACQSLGMTVASPTA